MYLPTALYYYFLIPYNVHVSAGKLHLSRRAENRAVLSPVFLYPDIIIMLNRIEQLKIINPALS